MMDVRSLARLLDGEIKGRDAVSCPGPGHSRKDRSLSVRINPNAPDGFVCYSHAGDDWKVCRDYVRQRLGLPVWEPGDERNRTIPERHIKKWDLAVIESEAEMRERTRHSPYQGGLGGAKAQSDNSRLPQGGLGLQRSTAA
jgi:putative DNA primase/helicase